MVVLESVVGKGSDCRGWVGPLDDRTVLALARRDPGTLSGCVPRRPDVRIGITGHLNLTVESAPLVAAAMRAELAAHANDGVVGVSCLARGADQLSPGPC